MSNFRWNDERGVIAANNYQTPARLTKAWDDHPAQHPRSLGALRISSSLSLWRSLGHNSAAGRVGVTKFYSSLNLELRDALITQTRSLLSRQRQQMNEQSMGGQKAAA